MNNLKKVILSFIAHKCNDKGPTLAINNNGKTYDIKDRPEYTPENPEPFTKWMLDRDICEDIASCSVCGEAIKLKELPITNTFSNILGEKIIYDKNGQYIWAVQKNGHHQKIADLRGWGAIQNLFKDKSGNFDIEAAEKYQDDLGEMIANVLNEKLIS